MVSVLAPHLPDDIDPGWIGLLDARMSGWYARETDELFRGFRISAQDNVLDVGCGDGVSALFCGERGAHVTCVDIDEGTISGIRALLQEQGTARGIEAFVSDSDPMPVADGYASRVICQEVLEHVADPARVIAELVRAGQPGALYLLTVPGERSEKIQQAFAPPDYFEHPNHIRIFSKDDFVAMAESAGLEVLDYSGNGFFWTFWACMHWAIVGAEARRNEGDYSAVQAPFAPPYDASLRDWANLWNRLIATPEGEAFKREMDGLLPKSQLILARKSQPADSGRG